MDNQSSSLSVPQTSSTSSTGRIKVALKPGRSLMDWIRFTHSGRDLTSTGGKCLNVTPRELARHNSKKDAWISLKGKVYNITPYLEYHPGGEDELMRGAGKDATDLFNQVHRWVNAESMLQKCFVGVLKKPWSLEVPRLPSVNPLKSKHKKLAVESISIAPSKSPEGVDEKSQLSFAEVEWPIVSSDNASCALPMRCCVDEDKVNLVIECSSMKPHELIIDLICEKLLIKFSCDPLAKPLKFEFPALFKENIEVKFQEENILEMSLEKEKAMDVTCNKPTITWTFFDKTEECSYWPCTLIKKIPVNHNTFLFTFLLPPHTRMWVPIGHHVLIKSYIENMEIVRSYTPVLSSLENCTENPKSDGCHIILMIKIYPRGALTPVINQCNIGENMLISNYLGNFSEVYLQKCNSVVMLAAGTGITPMIKIINWIKEAKDRKRSLLLLFFNKTEEDILWQTEFEKFSLNYENFQVIHILSEASEKWHGFTGAISKEFLGKVLPAAPSVSNQQIFICGPLPFTNVALRYLQDLGYDQDFIFAFTG